MLYDRCPLVAALRAPASTTAMDGLGWDVLVRQARRAEMLGSLRVCLDDHGLLDAVPRGPRAHLESGYVVACKQVRDVRWEVRCVLRDLRRTGVRLILLKGAAYVMADLPVGRSRVFSDVDVLVPKTSIEAVEAALLDHHWVHMIRDAYDQHYFRTWMHQIPPLMHLQRESVLDVHHTLVPETSRIGLDRERLFAEAREVPGHDRLAVLAPPHMVLHSASHLFDNGEFEHTLRDLADLDALLRHFGSDPAFWGSLERAAQVLGLERDLYFALRYAGRFLGTPVPEALVERSRERGPPAPLARLLDALFDRALAPDHPDARSVPSALARWALYVRSHYLRMPWPLLLPHLVRKGWRRVGGE